MKRRALFSVSDKTGVVELARAVAQAGYEILSTGGTAKALRAEGIDVIGVSDVTGFPECLDGRLKTLHPVIHGGILAMRDNPQHMEQMQTLGIGLIDIVVINLYPFKQTVLKQDVSLEEAIENIDIGGPAMIRAAAKNWQDVSVLVDPSDYGAFAQEMRSGGIARETKFRLAAKVFEHTAHYDALIAEYLRHQLGEAYPETLTLTFEKQQGLRYGENPHQTAGFYREVGLWKGTVPACEQLHGKELSYNNIADLDAALAVVGEFAEPCVVAVKHQNPCGVGIGDTLSEAWTNAYEADPVSIYGGIIALNRTCDVETAQKMSQLFLEVIVAPAFSDEALEALTQKQNIRLLTLDRLGAPEAPLDYNLKRVSGGLLLQSPDDALYDGEPKPVTMRTPTKQERETLDLAWRVCKHVKSNAIVLAKGRRTVGIGPGQTNRIGALEIALKAAGDNARGSVMASDAYFPFPDCVEAAGQAGVTAIIQPGGSKGDEASILKCNAYGMAMLVTGMRHFKH